MCQSPVPALSTVINSLKFSSSTNCLKTACAVGDLQIFPKQTAVMRKDVDRGDGEDTPVMLIRREGNIHPQAVEGKARSNTTLSREIRFFIPRFSPRCPQSLGGCPQEVHTVVDSARGHTCVASVASWCCELQCHRPGVQRVSIGA